MSEARGHEQTRSLCAFAAHLTFPALDGAPAGRHLGGHPLIGAPPMGLKIDPWSFPDPEATESAPGAGRRAIVLAGGCFWCVEACYRDLKGVLGVRPGYA